jgi:hypothetical protein
MQRWEYRENFAGERVANRGLGYVIWTIREAVFIDPMDH